MADNDWKKNLGVVFSTNPDFNYNIDEELEVESIAPSRQKLIVAIDKKQRAGKQVTVVKGFIGKKEELEELGKKLKSRCGVGGSAKDGIILIQGDFRDRVIALLSELGYNAKRGN